MAGINLRPSVERGHVNHGWLDSYFTFSFAEYHDPQHMGYRTLRVINEDRVGAGQGFGMHPHRDMEIFTYVIEGQLQHRDSMGHQSVIGYGQIQKITAGSGIQHSEFNASKKDPVHLLQIWIEPAQKGLKPSYQEIELPSANKEPLLLIGSPKGGETAMQFNQDVMIYRGLMKKGQEHNHKLTTGRGAWIQMVKGEVTANGTKLVDGDGVSIEETEQIQLKANTAAEFLLFDLQ